MKALFNRSSIYVGNASSATDIIEHNRRYIPTVILKVIVIRTRCVLSIFFLCIKKGTGIIANQLATIYQLYGREQSIIPERLSNERLLSEADLSQLLDETDKKNTLVFVCQPGKDELDEIILRAVGAG